MARFKIYSKDGQSVRYEGKPKYLGVYLNPSCLKFSEISSSEPIAWEVGDYVDYTRTGMRYRLYSIPQPSKEARRGSYGGAFRYSGVELYAATKELEIALFRDLVGNDNNIHFSTSPDVATFEDVYGIARRIQACMDDLYPGRWEIRVADFDADADAEILEKLSEAKDFALSGGTCLDALSKIYELWQDTGWIHSYENGKEVITIGYTNKRVDSNTSDSYIYGKGNGLTAIKKTQTNGEEFATRLYVYGSERNLPARYYNGLDILNAESVDIRNLMLPPDTWGQTDGLPDARKAYLENAEAVAKFGVIPKTHYFDSEDAGADIYPTIERLTIGEIRDAMSPDDDYYPSESYADTDRADAVLSAENPSDDGVINPNGKEYDAKAYLSIQSLDKTVNMVGGLRESPLLTDHPLFSKTIETDFSRGKVVVDLSQTIAIPDKGFSSVVARVTIGDDEQAGYGTTVGSNAFPAVKSEDGKNWEIKLGRISAEYGKSELYDNTEYNVYGHVSITANTVGVESSEITIVFRPGSGSIGIKRILDKTFRLNLKQIGFDINEQASLGKGKTISMKTGACAGRNFVISDCFYSSAYDSWVLTCKRQQDDTLGMLFPNNAYEIAEGDTFVLVDIAMPSLYISVAMNRLLSEGQKFLARASKIQSHYEPSIDAKVMAESGRTLREGMFMEITDEDVVDNTTDYILIDTLSISEDEGAIPTYKVTLRERRKVTYKGTPSATSATETKSVEDETEVQPNVDLTGYAKETYVNDKVSEVNNLLASMWSLDDDGNLVTDRNVIIKNNLIVTKDTSTGGTGTDQGVSGTVTGIRVDANTILEPTNGIVDMSDVLANLGVDVDLSDYYTKQETLAEIASAIAEINIPSLDGYATEAYVTDAITALNLGQYATTASLATLQTEVDNIEAVLGMDEEAGDIINTWNEVKAFLGSIEVDDDLASILERMNADIATRALDSDLDTLAGRVGVNELAIADNAGNIKKNFDAIGTLESNKADWGTTLAGYGITDAYTTEEIDGKVTAINSALALKADTTALEALAVSVEDNATNIRNLKDSVYTKEDLATYKAWWDDVMSLVVKDGNNIKIKTNLIVSGDTSSTARGSDAGVAGTLLGITVNGTTYNEPVNGILALPDYPTTLPASDVYDWAKKSSLALADVPDLSSRYLSVNGGTITRSDRKQLLLKNSNASGLSALWIGGEFEIFTHGAQFLYNGELDSIAIANFASYKNSSKGLGAFRITKDNKIQVGDVNFSDGYVHDIIHSGNYSSYALPLSGGTISANTAIPLYVKGTSAQSGIILGENKAQLGWGYVSSTIKYSGYIYNYTSKAYLGVSDSGVPHFNDNTLYHTGNFNPADYLPLIGGTITGALKINTHTDRSLILDEPTGEKYHHISFAAGGVEYARITSTNLGTVNELLFNGETLIHSGNIGSYNAGSATKLATARTIWGQSFDGTGNVSGNIYGGIRDFVIYGYDGSAAYNIIDADSNNKNLWIGYGSAPRSHDTSIAGKNVLLLYGESRNYGLILNSSGGNVTIGASDLAGTAFKLSVDGKTAIRATYRNGYPTLGSLSANSDFNVAYYDAQDGSQYGMYVSVNGYNGNSVIQAGRNDGITTAYNLLLNPLGGNVLIGTTTDSGYKLDVAGTARCGKNEDGADLLVFKMGREWRFQQSGEAASAALVLRTLENGKYFHLRNNANETAFTYVAQNSANRLYAYCPTEINSTFNVNGAVTMSSTLSVSKLTKLSNTTRYALEITTSANSHIMSFNGVDGNESAQIGYTSNGLYGFNYDAYRNDIRTHVTGFGISNDGIFYISPTGNPTTSNAYFKVASGGNVTIVKNLIVGGDTATGSDIRFKDRIADHRIALESIAQAPLFTFKWNDREDKTEHLGTSAQYWEGVAPWLVKGTDFKALDYSTLGVAMGVSLAKTTLNHEKRINTHEERITILENKIKALEAENRRIQYGS